MFKIANEIWKIIEEHPNYKVSNLGRVRSLGFIMNNGHFRKGKILKLHDNTTRGYLRVNLNGKWKRVHRLVAQAFIPNPNNKPQVNHKDGNKLNNKVENLEWCTPSENLKHSFDIGLRKKQFGLDNPNTKLTLKDVEYIRKNYKAGSREFGGRSLSKKLNISRVTVSNIINDKCNY